MRSSRWLWLGLAALLAAGTFVAYAALNLDAYIAANRDAIAERASRALGRTVRFDKLSLSLRRGLGIEVQGLAVAEDPRFGNGDAMTAESAVVRLRLLPALFGEYAVSRVLLDRPDIRVVRRSSGFNFSTLARSEQEAAETRSEGTAATVAVAMFDVENGILTYRDETASPPTEIVARQVGFRASDLSFGEELRFELSATVFANEAPDLKASGTVGPLETGEVMGSPIDVVVQLDDVDSRRLTAVLGSAPGVEMSGPVNVNAQIGGTLGAWTVRAAINGKAALLRYGTALEKPAGTPMSLVAEIAREADESVAIDPIEIEVAGSELTGRVRLVSGPQGVAYEGGLRGAGLPLADWVLVAPALRASRLDGSFGAEIRLRGATASGLETIDGHVTLDGVGANPEHAPSFSQLSTTIVLEGRGARMPASALRIGGAPAQLSARVADLTRPELEITVRAERLPLASLAPLFAPDSPDVLTDVEVEAKAPLTGSMGGTARLRIGSGTVARLPFDRLEAAIAATDAGARIDPLRFRTCGGELTGRGDYRLRGGTSGSPRFLLRLQGNGIDVGTATRALAPAAAPLLSGKGSFGLELDGPVADWTEASRALSGSGRFELADGALLGTNLAEAVLEGMTGVPGLSTLLPPPLREEFPGVFAGNDTPFDRLATAFQLANGKLATRDLTLTARDFVIRADGSVGLDLSADLAGKLVTSGDLSRRLTAQVAALRYLADREGAVTIPFRVAGTLPAASVKPDSAAIAAALQRGLIGTLGEKLLGGDTFPGKRRAPEASQ